jgi:hypothetical protein
MIKMEIMKQYANLKIAYERAKEEDKNSIKDELRTFLYNNPSILFPMIGNKLWEYIGDYDHIKEVLQGEEERDKEEGINEGMVYYDATIDYTAKALEAVLRMVLEWHIESNFKYVSFGQTYVSFWIYAEKENKTRFNIETDILHIMENEINGKNDYEMVIDESEYIV